MLLFLFVQIPDVLSTCSKAGYYAPKDYLQIYVQKFLQILFLKFILSLKEKYLQIVDVAFEQ